jgi:hypothetical protein
MAGWCFEGGEAGAEGDVEKGSWRERVEVVEGGEEFVGEDVPAIWGVEGLDGDYVSNKPCI